MLETLEKNFKIVIKDDIRKTQTKTILQANSNLIMLYYRIGKIMFENSKYGNSFIKNVATGIKIEYIGQLNFYITAVNKTIKKEQDNNTIGLLLDKNKDR